MAKTKDKSQVAIETLAPYVKRAIEDPELREDLLAAFVAARSLYGQLAKPSPPARAKPERRLALLARQRALERAGHEPARRRDVVRLEQHRSGLGQRRHALLPRGHVHPAGCEEDVLGVLPRDEEGVRSDDAVVAEPEQRGGMDLEVEVRRA